MLKSRLVQLGCVALRTLCAGAAVASLAACSSDSAAPSAEHVDAVRPVAVSKPSTPGTDFVQWRCMGNTQVQWRYTDSSAEQIDLRAAGDDIMHRLSKRPASTGVTYSDGLLAFDLRGDTGRLYLVPSGKNIDHGCQAE